MYTSHPAKTSILNLRKHRAAASQAKRGDASPFAADSIIREPECRKITGLSRSTRWRLERDGMFPRRRRVSPGCSGWLRSEITAWVAALRIEKSCTNQINGVLQSDR
jgi:prophage regulatory protein